jgi:hypothetical protein
MSFTSTTIVPFTVVQTVNVFFFYTVYLSWGSISTHTPANCICLDIQTPAERVEGPGLISVDSQDGGNPIFNL